MNSVEENIIEMTLVWSQIADQLDDDVDSLDIKQSIVELANEYSTPKSGKFINGILDSIAKEKNLKIKKIL